MAVRQGLCWLLLTLIISANLLASQNVWAEESDLSRTARARALYTEGVSHADAERWSEAADRFSRALALRPSPATAYNLAYALENLGRFLEAREALARHVLRTSGASEELVSLARELDELLVARIGRLVVRLSGAGDGVDVLVDGRNYATELIGIETPIDPGRHEIEAHRDGVEIASAVIVIEDGGHAEAILDIPPPPVDNQENIRVEVAEPVTPSPPTPLVRRWWFWTIIGAAVIATGVGLGVGLGVENEADPVTGNFDPGLVEIGR